MELLRSVYDFLGMPDDELDVVMASILACYAGQLPIHRCSLEGC